MNKLNLHPSPAGVVVQASRVIERVIDLAHVQLGGGTALEARWHHRASTDLDFFASGASIDTLFYKGFNQVSSVLADCWQKGEINGERPRIARRAVLHFEIDGTPVSLGRVDGFEGESDDHERQTGIRLATNRDVLTKKLCNRLLGNGIATERDAYDFLVARHLDPDALGYAWAKVTSHERVRVAQVIRGRIEQGRQSPPSDSPLTAPAYPNLAQHLWDDLIEMFESDLRHAPSLSYPTMRTNDDSPHP